MNNETLGRRILRRRKDVGLAQRELGKALGISHATISLWESDKTEPSGKNLHALARVLQCTPTWILFGDDEQSPAEPIPFDLQPQLTDLEQEMLGLFRSLPDFEQEAQIQNLKSRVQNFSVMLDELLKARKRAEKK